MGAMDKKPLFVVAMLPPDGPRLGWYLSSARAVVFDDLKAAIQEADKLSAHAPGSMVLLSRVEMQWGPGINSKQGE